jgi:matrixin
VTLLAAGLKSANRRTSPIIEHTKLAMDRRTFILGLGSIAAGFPSSSHAQSIPRHATTWVVWEEIPTIVILSAEDDFRIRGVREAVDFWNAEFAQLGSPFRFGAIVRSFRSISAGDLVALKARRLSPVLVNSMMEANGDVIVALSDDADFNPFAFPSPTVRKVLVAIPSLRKYPFWPAAARSIAAHELGHAVGLDHNDDATSLMCGGTARCDLKFPNNGFAPLTSADKAKLLEMYPPNWQPKPSRRWKADPPAGTTA